MSDPESWLRETLRKTRVLPVLTVEDVAHALPLARALAAGGLGVLEITLRTPAALEAIETLAREAPEIVVGAGTVTRPEDLAAAAAAGARFAVSPGLTPELAAAGRGSTIPLMPGIMTPSEALAAREQGYRLLKFFPAEPAGGRALLLALAGPFPELLFCPTGGVGPDNYRAYLTLPNVACVGGSWVAPPKAVAGGDWARITRLAAEVRL